MLWRWDEHRFQNGVGQVSVGKHWDWEMEENRSVRKERMCLACMCTPHTHTYSYSCASVGSENEIFQAAISAANSITEGTCTKSCDFPDGEIGKG